MVEGRVDTAVGAEAEEMELLAGLLHIVVGGLDLGVLEKGMLAAGDVDLDEVLIDDAAGAEVHVSYLGVAHLSVGQADVFAAGLEMGHGIFCAEAVDEGRALRVDCIGLVVATFSPAVEDHQKYFMFHIVLSFIVFAAQRYK